MKKLLTLTIMLMSICAASAKSVVFTLSNGSLVYYLLGGDTNPVMKFTDGQLVVNTDTYEFSGIKNFYISEEDDPTAISELKLKPASFDGNTIVLATETSNVKVYDASGKEVKVEAERAGGHTSISLEGLKKGVYVVSVGKSSMKIMKK